MNEDKIKETLGNHKMWIDSDGKNGEKADLRGADLRGANLRGANLWNANLRNANLMSANLSYADLRNANLRGADLWNADLRGANLRGANLWNANLRNADLRNADLRGANLRGANLDYSTFPLWCGALDISCDVRLPAQLAYHITRLQCDDPLVRETQKALKPLAEKFHRFEECEKRS